MLAIGTQLNDCTRLFRNDNVRPTQTLDSARDDERPCAFGALRPGLARADETPGADAAPQPATKASPSAEDDAKLSVEQARLADRYKELERVILRMAEVMQPTDPKRAALLKQAFAQSKERQIDLQFEDVVKLLEKEQLYQANKGQVAVQQDLNRLLQLLLSGEREKQIANERVEIKKFIERINKLIRQQQGIQGETEGQGEVPDLTKRQGEVADKTGELAGDLKKFESRNEPAGSDSRQSDKAGDQPNDKKSGAKPEDKKAAGKPDAKPAGKEDDKKSADKPDGKSEDGKANGKPDDKSADKSGGKPGSKSDDKSADDQQREPGGDKNKPSGSKQDKPGGSPSPGESPGEEGSDNQPDKSSQIDQSQGRKRVQQAEERMRDARRRLEQANRRGADDEQEKALAELKLAKAGLEEILRQLREEEVERVLAALESRFRKMLEMQLAVNEGTVRLDSIAEDQRDHDVEIESGKLSRKESLITAEADKTLSLLREEGSSVAFPETVGQMREDMDQVAGRLARANVGHITQDVEKDIVASLEEMIAALQKAQKEQQMRRGGGGHGGGGNQEQPLLDQIAELKMIRSLQMQVNSRTQRYSKLLTDGAEQATEPDLVEALKRLGEREERVYRTTRDIVVGKNR